MDDLDDLKYFDSGFPNDNKHDEQRSSNADEGEVPEAGNLNNLSAAATSHIETIKITQDFVKEIETATLNNGNLKEDVIHRLHNPQEGPTDLSDPNTLLSLELFLATTNASEATYKSSRDAIQQCYPDSGVLLYHSVRNLVAEISGVVAIYNDMYINSCHAFTGPFFQLCMMYPDLQLQAERFHVRN